MHLDQVFSAQTIQLVVIYLVALVLSITVHEFGHALVADYLGDRLPRSQGRVTLNPTAHIDPIGTLLFPLIGFLLPLFDGGAFIGSRLLGWGKPVQISLDPRSMRRGMRRKTAHLLIAAAGPTMNVLFAAVVSLVFVALMRGGQTGLGIHVGSVVQMNLGLAFFNLIPCPPLDGGAILAGILPDGNPVVEFLERYGSFLFFALLLTGALSFFMLPARIVSSLWMGQLLHWIG